MKWAFLLVTLMQAVSASTPRPAGLGPKVDEPLPPFSLRDQDGRERDFTSLVGPQGLLLVFFRSADW